MLALAACKPATSAVEPAATPSRVTAPAVAAREAPPGSTPADAIAASAPPAAVTAEIAKSWSKGMAYTDLRKSLLRAGWLPLRDPKCWDNVGGEAQVCGYLPEVVGCSGDGYCKMRFAHRESGLRAQIGTYGPYDPSNTTGDGKALKIRFWEFQSQHAPASPACPSRDFDEFLKRFASDKNVQRQFIAPVVKVMELRSDGDGDWPQPVYMLAEDYSGFNVEYRDGAYHFIDGEGRADPSRLRLTASPRGDGKRLVRYNYNMSEGNSYLFENTLGCWRLSEDPDAPAS